MNFAKYGGRRFLMALGCGVVCTALLWFEKIDQTVFRDLVGWTVAAYITGNVFQKKFEAGASHNGETQ